MLSLSILPGPLGVRPLTPGSRKHIRRLTTLITRRTNDITSHHGWLTMLIERRVNVMIWYNMIWHDMSLSLLLSMNVGFSLQRTSNRHEFKCWEGKVSSACENLPQSLHDWLRNSRLDCAEHWSAMLLFQIKAWDFHILASSVLFL